MPEPTEPYKTTDVSRAYSRWYKRYGPNSTRAWFREFKKTLKCERCPESHPGALDFHHLDPTVKDSTIKDLVRTGTRQQILDEIGKCQVLCANCHRKLHWMESQVEEERDNARWKQLFDGKEPIPAPSEAERRKRLSEIMKAKWRDDPEFAKGHATRIANWNRTRGPKSSR